MPVPVHFLSIFWFTVCRSSAPSAWHGSAAMPLSLNVYVARKIAWRLYFNTPLLFPPCLQQCASQTKAACAARRRWRAASAKQFQESHPSAAPMVSKDAADAMACSIQPKHRRLFPPLLVCSWVHCIDASQNTGAPKNSLPFPRQIAGLRDQSTNAAAPLRVSEQRWRGIIR